MCLHPVIAWPGAFPDEDGKRHLSFTPPSGPYADVILPIQVPCGKCIGCLDDRRKRWVNRLLIEFDYVQTGTFITLTYRDAPEHPSKSDAQKFIKRLRHASRDYGVFFPADFKYFLCAERGSQYGRPHYHALLFGVDMMLQEWQPYIATFKGRYPVWSSHVLEKIWPHGFCTIGDINPAAIRYVAKYTVKTVGQEDTFTLKSMRLGCSKFFNIRKKGRTVDISYKHENLRHLLINGNIHLFNGKGDTINVRIPRAFDRYVERISPLDLYDLKIIHGVQSAVFRDKKTDLAAYEERLKNNEKKEKLKRNLDYEKRICHP